MAQAIDISRRTHAKIRQNLFWAFVYNAIGIPLAAFGAPRGLVKRSHLLKPDIVVQVGVEPSRVDILTSIDGVKFEAAYKARTETEVGGVRVPFVSLAHLIQNKRATGRERDQSDVAMLQAATKRRKAR